MLLGLLLIGVKAGTFDMVALATDNGVTPQPHHAARRRARHRHRPRREGPDVAAAQLAARRPHRRPHRRLGAARRRAAEDGHLRPGPDRAADRARRHAHLRPLPGGLRRRRHHLRLARLPRAGPPGRQGRPQAADRLLLRRPHGLRAARHRHPSPPPASTAPCSPTSPTASSPACSSSWSAPSRTATAPPTSTRSPAAPAPPSTAGAPRFGGLLAFGAVASLGLPGLAGFWGEMLAMFGAFEPAAGLSRPAFLTFMALAAFGTLLTAAYLLIVVRRVCMGDRDSRAAPQPGPGRRPRLRVRRLDPAGRPHRPRRTVARGPPRPHRPGRTELLSEAAR